MAAVKLLALEDGRFKVLGAGDEVLATIYAGKLSEFAAALSDLPAIVAEHVAVPQTDNE